MKPHRAASGAWSTRVLVKAEVLAVIAQHDGIGQFATSLRVSHQPGLKPQVADRQANAVDGPAMVGAVGLHPLLHVGRCLSKTNHCTTKDCQQYHTTA